MSKEQAFALAYAAALQGRCSKYGAVLVGEREQLHEFCLAVATEAANGYSRFFRANN